MHNLINTESHWQSWCVLTKTDNFESDHFYYTDEIIFTIDDEILGSVTPPQGGFWEMGNFTGPKLWDDDKMSPFNQPVC